MSVKDFAFAVLVTAIVLLFGLLSASMSGGVM